MKFRVLTVSILMTLMVVTGACSKNSDRPDSDPVLYLTGVWELRNSFSMIGDIQYPGGNGNRLEFTQSDYKVFEEGILKKEGAYKIEIDHDVNSDVCGGYFEGFAYLLVYNNVNNDVKRFIRVNGNSLFMIYGCFALDSGSKEEYVRISN